MVFVNIYIVICNITAFALQSRLAVKLSVCALSILSKLRAATKAILVIKNTKTISNVIQTNV